MGSCRAPRGEFRGILGTVAEDLYQTLMRFHRAIAVPDMETTIREPLQREIRDLRDEMHTDSDALWKQMETLNQEYEAIKAGLKRLEEWPPARSWNN